MIEYHFRRGPKKNKDSLNTTTQKVVNSLIITLTLMILALSGFSFIITNQGSQKGYTLEQQKLKNEHLKAENEGLNAKLVQSKASNEISQKQNVTSMGQIIDKTFLTKEDNKVE